MIFAKFELPIDKWDKIKPTLENCHIVELGVMNQLFAVDIMFEQDIPQDLLIYEVFPEPCGIHTFLGMEDLYLQRFNDFNSTDETH
jgi:hypothetical protein